MANQGAQYPKNLLEVPFTDAETPLSLYLRINQTNCRKEKGLKYKGTVIKKVNSGARQKINFCKDRS